MYFTQLNYQKPESIFLLLQTSVGLQTPCARSLVHLLAPLGNRLIKGISAPEHLAAASTAANLVKFIYRVWEIHFQVFCPSGIVSLHLVTEGLWGLTGNPTGSWELNLGLSNLSYHTDYLSLDESWKKVFQQEENNLGSLQRGKNMLI